MPRLRSTCTAMIVSDISALLTALAAAFIIREFTGGDLVFSDYFKLVPTTLLFPALFGALGLYPGILRLPHEELKRLSIGVSVGFLFLSFFFFLGQQGIVYSRAFMLMSWLFSLLCVPAFRLFTRSHYASQPWWGYPVLLFADERDLNKAADELASHAEKGLTLAGKIILTCAPGAQQHHDFPVIDASDKQQIAEMFRELQQRFPQAIALIEADRLNSDQQQQVTALAGRHFHRVIIHMDSLWTKQISLRVADIPGGLVLTMRQNLLDPRRMRMKRFLDLVLCLLGSVVLIPAFPLLALCIRLDSKGPVFFRQQRIGQDGKPFKVFKFRTMVHNADKTLTEIIAGNPQLRSEWEKDQKLTKDPRLTRIGVFLRRTSLDELPQILNVLRGEMSLVGPRPIVADEIERYGEAYALYTRVKPGMTGIWQVSGRSRLDYSKRVDLDQHYVYNWSVWLDIYIIIRTIPAIVTGDGAY